MPLTDPRPAPPPAPPLPFPLADALARIDKVFGIDRVLADAGRDQTEAYYIQSERGFRTVHSAEGCMHLALNPDGVFDRDGYLTQPRRIAQEITATGARSILELGAGQGFNSLHLARHHPAAQFTALDLMAHHVANATRDAADLPNLRCVQASFEPVPETLGRFDLVFGIETLCHAQDIDRVCRSVAQVLAPGGRLVIFDGYRRSPLEDCAPDIATASRLYEVSTAVAQGFRTAAEWEAALARAGLEVESNEDIGWMARPGLRRLHGLATRFFDDWKLRLAKTMLPPLLVRNAVAGIVGPYVIDGPGTTPDPECASNSYNLIIARKAQAGPDAAASPATA